MHTCTYVCTNVGHTLVHTYMHVCDTLNQLSSAVKAQLDSE